MIPMNPMTWTKTEAGSYYADNADHTRRYIVEKLSTGWGLSVYRMTSVYFASDDTTLYLREAGPAIDHDRCAAKWEAQLQANAWEASRSGDREASNGFWNQITDRIAGA